METTISLKGIVRNTSNLNSPAGSLHEIINLRKKYGSWRPILPKLAIKQNFAPSDEMFIHTMDESEYFITYNNDGTIKALTSQGAEVETIKTIASGHEIKFNSLGDFLIINDLTDFNKYIFRYYADLTPFYKDVSDIPFLNLSIVSAPVENNTFTYVSKRDQESFLAGWYLLEDDIRAHQYPEYFEGYVFLRWGIELIDGTILKHSMPVFLYNGNVSLADTPTEPMKITITFQLCQITYAIQAALPADWDNYKNLIRGVSIFMSKPVSKYDMERSGLTDAVNPAYLGLVEKTNLLIDLFRNESAYYRVHHIPFNKITAGATGTIGTSKPIASSVPRRGGLSATTVSPFGSVGAHYHPSTLSSQPPVEYGKLSSGPDRPYNPADFNVNDILSYEMLNTDDVSHHSIIGINSLNYNSRLFLGDIYTRLFDGYNISKIITPSGGTITEFDLYIEIEINTSLGMRTIRQTMKSTKDSIILPYIIGYPDFRATEIRIIHNSGGTLKKSTFALESHPLLNLAFATKLNGTDLNAAAKDATGTQTLTIAGITTAATLATLKTSLRDKNRVQVTELYNPYIMPPLYSYQVGEGNNIALAVNMLPLKDRFGTFPVFVFTSRGVWALNLSDSGNIIVSNIVPVSSSVCTNPDSVIVVDNLLVFLASDGIKLLTGQTPAEISDLAETTPLSVLAGNSQYEQIKVQSLINDVSEQLSTVDLLAYCADACFAFNKKLREIIVSNYDYKYSYIFSLDEKIWYKCSQRFKYFINNYPNVYGLSTGNDLVNVSEEDLAGNIPVYLETKPLLIGPDKEIKLSKIILGGRFDVSLGFYGSLYVFGSNDGSYWALVTGKEINGPNIYNIVIPRLPISLRYIILVFSGTLKEESSISEFRILT